MKRLSAPLWVTIVILSGLLFSSVVAQSGPYSIFSWVVAGGGGGSTGGNYSVDGTSGQSVAGRSTGGVYTLDSGYWPQEDTTPVQLDNRIYLPQVARGKPGPTFTPTPTTLPPIVPCNELEPSNDRADARPFPAIGRSCSGSFAEPNDDSDWFSVNLATGQTIDVRLTGIPSGDDYDIYLYRQGITSNLTRSARQGSADEDFTYQAPSAGIYLVRVFAYEKGAPVHPYLLSVNVT